MPVPKKKIKERLMEMFPKAKNLGRARMVKLTTALAKIPADDADDDAIDEVIATYDEAFSIEEMAKQDDTIRTLRKKSTTAPAAEEEEEEEEEVEPVTTVKKKEGELSMTEKLLQKMAAGMEKLTTEVSDLKSGKIIESKKSQVAKLFESSEVLKKLPETMQKRLARTIDFENTEVSIEDQIAELEEENEDFFQTLADNTDIPGSPPSTSSTAKPSDKEVEDVVAEM